MSAEVVNELERTVFGRLKKGNAEAPVDPLRLLDSGAVEADELDAAALALVDAELSEPFSIVALESLTAALEPPAGLRRRLAQRIDRRLRARTAMLACADLFTTGWHTARTLVGPDMRPNL